ncbi:MAG: histidine--tRNA ligase [Planctomycetota bacterium]|jgi:histidyl-tRNA synthetase
MSPEPFRNARGTRDLLPQDLILVRHLERVAQAVAGRACYQEIRTPLFEETRLFQRSLGETSDVVSKEMFSVPRRTEGDAPASGLDGYTFRPENTAGVVRAYVQGGFAASAPLQKWFYIGPMFRYERPQKGRERQFTQFGVEAFGAQSPSLDAEVVGIALAFFRALGFDEQLEVRVNSMGDPRDRVAWSEELRVFFAPQFAKPDSERCADCKVRFERNIFRLLDCKVPRCVELNAGAPDLFSVMGVEAREHHTRFGECLRATGFDPVEDRSIVRGLDYYTRTVFEVHYPPLGARSALCGGGRYDGLVEEMGGRPTPGVGFSVGFTPTELALKELQLPPASDLADLQAELEPQVYAVAISDEDRSPLLKLVTRLRSDGLRCALDHRGKSAKAQFKEASKSGAACALVLGAEERAQEQVVLRDLRSKEERTVAQAGLASVLHQALARGSC